MDANGKASLGAVDAAARNDGFTIVELTVATGLTLVLMAAIFTLTRSSQAASTSHAEAADMQQRTRVAVDTITRDLIAAGAGSYLPGYRGPLTASIPAVLPFRRGMVGTDAAGTFRDDTITVISVPTTAAQTTLSADLGVGSLTIRAAAVPVCTAGVNLCSFSPGMTILAFDAGGAFQVFTVAAVIDPVLQITTTTPAARLYRAGTPLVEAEIHSYYRKTDAATQISQLMHYDGTSNADIPVLDHVAGLAFDYGVPRQDLVDGPWRPDAVDPERWDADLLRIRTVQVTVRLEAALRALRGPAGVLFANGGVARDPAAWVPDQEIRFHVSPRNLSLKR